MAWPALPPICTFVGVNPFPLSGACSSPRGAQEGCTARLCSLGDDPRDAPLGRTLPSPASPPPWSAFLPCPRALSPGIGTALSVLLQAPASGLARWGECASIWRPTQGAEQAKVGRVSAALKGPLAEPLLAATERNQKPGLKLPESLWNGAGCKFPTSPVYAFKAVQPWTGVTNEMLLNLLGSAGLLFSRGTCRSPILPPTSTWSANASDSTYKGSQLSHVLTCPFLRSCGWAKL